MWNDILGRRDDHLSLAREHFSLDRDDVRRYVLENSKY
jgi:hypothetical protein